MKSTDPTSTTTNVGPTLSLFTLSSGITNGSLRQKQSFLDQQRMNKPNFARSNPVVMVTPSSRAQRPLLGFPKAPEMNKVSVQSTSFLTNVQNKVADLKLGNSLTQPSRTPPSFLIDGKQSNVINRSAIGYPSDELAKVRRLHQNQFAQSNIESLKENVQNSMSQASGATTSLKNSILQTAEQSNSIQNIENEKEYTIRHFTDGKAESARGLINPSLGRFNLSESLNPLKGFEKIFNWMRKVPLIYLPLFAWPNAALAYDAPPGFEDFAPIHENGDFVQDLITINKQGICFFQDALMHLGLNGSAGLSIIIWAACLKVLTTPFYENALKYPTQMEKAVQDVIEAQLKRNNPDNYTYESDQQPEEPQVWTNPIKAQLAPVIYRFGVILPLFYIEAQSLIQLIQERPEFKQPFLWIPCLDGPSQELGIAWMQNHSFSENMPYLFLPALIAMQMFINNMVKEQYSLPEDPDDEKIVPINFDLALPFLMGGAALASPAAVSLNLFIAQQLAVLQFFLMREKLKKVDGLDIEQIRLKDQELKAKMENGETMQNPNLRFDFDSNNGNIKVNEAEVILKNETQRNFLNSYNNKQ